MEHTRPEPESVKSMSMQQKLKVKSILPKNAFNYYSLRKGLYLSPQKRGKSNRGYTEACTLANAYDSVIPVLQSL